MGVQNVLYSITIYIKSFNKYFCGYPAPEILSIWILFF